MVLAFWNAFSNSVVHTILSLDAPFEHALSSGAKKSECFGITLLRNLYDPMKDLMFLIVCGGSQTASVFKRWDVALSVPFSHCQPRISVEVGQMIVLFGDSLKLLLCRASKTFSQTEFNSVVVLAPA